MGPSTEELEGAALAAAQYGEVTGVLAAEPALGERVYLVALAGDERPSWVVVDDGGAAIEGRKDVRSTASIVALCELAADLAGGGDLASLRQQLAEVRIVENPPGIEEAEAAAAALERAIGQPPRVASPAYLDDLGAATATLEHALGDGATPFTAALRAGTATIDEFVRDVESGYALPLV